MRSVAVASLWIAGAALVGCGPGRERPPAPPPLQEPTELFEIGSITTRASIFRWQFADDPPGWIHDQEWVGRGRDFALDGRGLVARLPAAEVVVRCPVDFDASAVDAIALEGTGFRGIAAELHWIADGVGSPAHAERVANQPLLDGKVRRFEFDVTRNPLWKGRIGELRFALEKPASEPAVIRTIDGVGYRVDPDRLAAAVQRPWKVTIGHDTRTARLTPPGVETVQAVRIPSVPSSLQVAYGTLGPLPGQLDFAITARRLSGERVPLFTATMAPGNPTGSWHSVAVDVSPFAGEQVDLVFETRAGKSPEAFDLVSVQPFWTASRIVVTSPAAPLAMNVVLISIDTLRADHLSLYGYPRRTSPRLDAWAARAAVTFERTVVQAPWTLPSHASMLSGTDPLRHGANHRRSRAPAELDMLAEVLRDAGYATAAVTGAGYLNPRYGFTQGHDRYYSAAEEVDAAVDRALGLVDGLSQPFYLFFHTYQVHEPYTAREPWFRELSGRAEDSAIQILNAPTGFVAMASRARIDDQALGVDMYDSGIGYMDTHVARLLERLAQPDLATRTVVVFTSDHGDGLGDPGHGHPLLWENNLLVPLVIAFPDRMGAGSRVRRQVRSVDIFPTILERVGLAARVEIDGVSLLPLLADAAAAFPATATSYSSMNGLGLALRVDDRVKFVQPTAAAREARGEAVLYELRTDPLERMAGAADRPAANRLRAEAARRFAAANGLWVRVQNASERTLTGSLEGAGITEFTLTSVDLDCACVTVERPGRAVLEVPPGTTFSLLLELVEMDVLGLELELGDDARSGLHTVQVGELDGHVGLGYADESWSYDRSPGAAVKTGVEVWWRGGRRLAGPDAELDPALAEQLRALGYVN